MKIEEYIHNIYIHKPGITGTMELLFFFFFKLVHVRRTIYPFIFSAGRAWAYLPEVYLHSFLSWTAKPLHPT